MATFKVQDNTKLVNQLETEEYYQFVQAVSDFVSHQTNHNQEVIDLLGVCKKIMEDQEERIYQLEQAARLSAYTGLNIKKGDLH